MVTREMHHPDSLKNLLYIIDAPNECIGLKEVLENLRKILPFLPTIDSVTWEKRHINQMIDACNVELKQPEKYSKKTFSYIENTKGCGLIRFKTSNPLYAAIWTAPPNKRASTAYHHLQAQLINCHVQLREKRNTENIESVIYESALGVRKLSTKNDEFNVLSQIQATPVNLPQFYKLWKSLIKNNEGKYLNAIERLLAYTLEIRDPHASPTSRNATYAEIEVLNESEQIDTNSEADDVVRDYFYTSNISENESNEARMHGNSAEECYAGPTYFTENQTISLNRGESITSHARGQKKRSRNIARRNQSLPNKWDRLNLNDVCYLYREIKKLSEGKGSFDELDVKLQVEFSALICLMHFTASNLNRAVNARLVSSTNDLPENISENAIFICIKERVWVVGKFGIGRRKKRSSWKNYFEESFNRIELRINDFYWEFMKAHVHLKSRDLKKRSRALFDNETAIINQFPIYIAKINKKYHARLTEFRISNHIYDLLSDLTSDTADAALITGKNVNIGQKVALYYYCPSIESLQQKYQSTSTILSNAIMKHVPTKFHNEGYSKITLADSELRIGSNICPLKKTVALFVEDLINSVRHHKKDHRHPSHLINFHNAYTTYCILMIGFTTGYRAVRDPFYAIYELDCETGLMVISDKDGDDYYNARIVWLPDLCLDQLNEYKQYRTILATNLILTNPELSQQLRQLDNSSWGNNSNNHTLLPYFFYLKSDHKTKVVKPINMHENIKWITDIPLNINRHYLRTRLREEGVEGELVDAFLGHWEHGQEPFGYYSSISPQQFIEAIKDPIERLLKSAGWKVLKGVYG